MLTTEGLLTRKWGSFPELRKILQTHTVPNSYYGPTSVSRNIFSDLQDLAEVAVIVRENQADIEERATPHNLENLAQDLIHLKSALGLGTHFFSEHADFFERLADNLRGQFRRVLSVPSGHSYQHILKHHIYSCPDSYKYQDVRLISPRTAEGFMEKIFTIKKVCTAHPKHLNRDVASDEARKAIAAYTSDAPKRILNKPGKFRFYILDPDPAFELPHCPRPRKRLGGPAYFHVEQLTKGPPVVEPRTS